MIPFTYGFGLAPLLRGKLFEGQEREKGQGEGLRELALCFQLLRGGAVVDDGARCGRLHVIWQIAKNVHGFLN